VKLVFAMVEKGSAISPDDLGTKDNVEERASESA
jgi:hypothetical protein